VIVSAIQVVEGHDRSAVVRSWSGSTAETVANAVKSLTASLTSGTGRLG